MKRNGIKSDNRERNGIQMFSLIALLRSKVQPYVCVLIWLIFRMETAILKVATDFEAAASKPGQEHKAVSKVKQKARAFLQEMVANISPAFIRY